MKGRILSPCAAWSPPGRLGPCQKRNSYLQEHHIKNLDLYDEQKKFRVVLTTFYSDASLGRLNSDPTLSGF